MTTNSETRQGLEPIPVNASVTRRHLLKTAAAAAPIIATLPSGAALAQASSVQCAAKLQADPLIEPAAPFAPATDNPLASTTNDQWVQVEADYWYRESPSLAIWYRYTFNSESYTIYSTDGATWITDGPDPGNTSQNSYKGKRYLLVLWELSSQGDSLSQVGVYPLDGLPQANGELGMTTSCLASFSGTGLQNTQVRSSSSITGDTSTQKSWVPRSQSSSTGTSSTSSSTSQPSTGGTSSSSSPSTGTSSTSGSTTQPSTGGTTTQKSWVPRSSTSSTGTSSTSSSTTQPSTDSTSSSSSSSTGTSSTSGSTTQPSTGGTTTQKTWVPRSSSSSSSSTGTSSTSGSTSQPSSGDTTTQKSWVPR